MSNYAFLFKYIIIGDSSVGKSCMLVQFLERKFKIDHDPTIGVEFGAKIVSAKGLSIKLQIWDTAGQQTFKSITRSYYRGSIGAVLVYDVTNRQSFDNIGKWLDQTKSYSNDKISLILVGNKIDLENKRVVSSEEGQDFAKKHNMLFIQTSAKTNLQIDATFNRLTEKIHSRIEKKEVDATNQSLGIKMGNMHQEKSSAQKKACC